MSTVTVEELLHSVRHYYPVGFPPEADTCSPGPEFHQLTPEFGRFQDAWSNALKTEPWGSVMDALQVALPTHEFGCYTPAYQSACYVCVTYQRGPRPDAVSGYRLVRIAGAISLIAPVYLVYGTVELVSMDRSDRERRTEQAVEELSQQGTWEQRFTRFKEHLPAPPQLFLHPTEEMQPTASIMAKVIEQKLGYRAFPPELADVPVPDVRVPFLNLEPATLLNALFLSNPENLV